MTKIGRFLNKFKTGKIGNKKIPKFLPVFLMLIITIAAFGFLIKQGTFTKIFTKLFGAGTYNEEITYMHLELNSTNDRNDYIYAFVSSEDSDFTNDIVGVSLQATVSIPSSDFKNKDFLIVLDSKETPFGDLMLYSHTLSDYIIGAGNNNRMAVLYANSDSDFTSYQSNIDVIDETIENARESSTRTNAYKEAYTFLQNNNPASNRDTIMIYVTDKTIPSAKFDGYYKLIKSKYNNVNIIIDEANEHGYFNSKEEFNKISDEYYTTNEPTYGLFDPIFDLGYFNLYRNVEVSFVLTDYVEFDSVANNETVETYQSHGHQVVRLTIPKIRYTSWKDQFVLKLKIKSGAPEYVPLFENISFDYTDTDNQRKHLEYQDLLVVSQHFTVEYNANLPTGCNIEVPQTATYKKGTPVYFVGPLYCEGYEFLGWKNNYDYNSPIWVNDETFTTINDKVGFVATWGKVTINKYVEQVEPVN